MPCQQTCYCLFPVFAVASFLASAFIFIVGTAFTAIGIDVGITVFTIVGILLLVIALLSCAGPALMWIFCDPVSDRAAEQVPAKHSSAVIAPTPFKRGDRNSLMPDSDKLHGLQSPLQCTLLDYTSSCRESFANPYTHLLQAVESSQSSTTNSSPGGQAHTTAQTSANPTPDNTRLAHLPGEADNDVDDC